jgi:DNA-binding winged helix-turn-helix (wHTH) protein
MILRFDDCELDTGRFELRRAGAAVPVEPQVFDLLRLLIENRERIVTKDELFETVWDGRIVSDATLNSRINAARKAIGDNGTNQRLIRTAPRRGFRFIGEAAEEAGGPQSRSSLALRQEIRFCTSPGGVRLAWSTVGEGPPLVKTAHWLTHLEYDWEDPISRASLERLAASRRLIRYDERGTGLSDWDVEDISFDAFVRDLETVVDAAGLDRFALHGVSQGCAVSIAYAARHPERVSHLVLLNGYVQGRDRRGAAAEAEKVRRCGP